MLIPNPRDMDGFITAIKDAKFSVLPGVNTLFQGLTMHPRFREVDLSNYKIAIGGGSAVIKATSEKWKALTGHHIKEGYGLSETSPILCLQPDVRQRVLRRLRPAAALDRNQAARRRGQRGRRGRGRRDLRPRARR